jgi:hypothetical protein
MCAEEQDALIASGWHPGPMERRINSMYISTENKWYDDTTTTGANLLKDFGEMLNQTKPKPEEPDVVAVSSSEKHLRALQDDLRKAGYRRAAFK